MCSCIFADSRRMLSGRRSSGVPPAAGDWAVVMLAQFRGRRWALPLSRVRRAGGNVTKSLRVLDYRQVGLPLVGPMHAIVLLVRPAAPDNRGYGLFMAGLLPPAMPLTAVRSPVCATLARICRRHVWLEDLAPRYLWGCPGMAWDEQRFAGSICGAGRVCRVCRLRRSIERRGPSVGWRWRRQIRSCGSI